MSDFKYESYDQTALKVRFENFRQSDRKGFWYGVALMPLTYFLLSKKQTIGSYQIIVPAKLLAACLAGPILYLFDYIVIHCTCVTHVHLMKTQLAD